MFNNYFNVLIERHLFILTPPSLAKSLTATASSHANIYVSKWSRVAVVTVLPVHSVHIHRHRRDCTHRFERRGVRLTSADAVDRMQNRCVRARARRDASCVFSACVFCRRRRCSCCVCVCLISACERACGRLCMWCMCAVRVRDINNGWMACVHARQSSAGRFCSRFEVNRFGGRSVAGYPDAVCLIERLLSTAASDV